MYRCINMVKKKIEKKTCIFSILGIIFAFVFPLLGLIFGIVALVEISKDKKLGGKGLAIASIVISVVWPILVFLLVMGSFLLVLSQAGTLA